MGLGIKFFLLFERQRKEGARSVKDGGLQLTGQPVIDDLEEAGADAGGTHARDNICCFWGVWVRQERGDVDGWDVEFLGGSFNGGHGGGGSGSGGSGGHGGVISGGGQGRGEGMKGELVRTRTRTG